MKIIVWAATEYGSYEDEMEVPDGSDEEQIRDPPRSPALTPLMKAWFAETWFNQNSGCYGWLRE